jgi:hypothetical protein
MIAANDTSESEAGLYVEIDRKYQMPLKIPMFILGFITLFGIITSLFKGGWEGFIVGPTLFAIWWLFNVYPDRNYRIGWDNLRIYMREGSFTRKDYRSIAFADIRTVETHFDSNAAAKARFYPFDYIEIRSRKSGQKPVLVHPPSLNDGQVKSMLLYLYSKRADLFPQEIIDYMYSDRPL